MSGLEHVASVDAVGIGCGFGLAASALLRRLVTSDCHRNTLTVFDIRPDGTFALLYSMGCVGDGPLQFRFFGCDDAGDRLCFSADLDRPTLLVLEKGNGRVQEVDVGTVNATFVGFPIYVTSPSGVAASAAHIVVTAWTRLSCGYHLAHVFDAATRVPLFVIGGLCGPADGQLCCPDGVRLDARSEHIAIADDGNSRVSVFRTSDGGFVQHVFQNDGFIVNDVEECEGEWIVGCAGFGSLVCVATNERHAAPSKTWVSSLVFVPGVGLVARSGYTLHVFSTPETRRMNAQSAVRLAWLGCIIRAEQRGRANDAAAKRRCV